MSLRTIATFGVAIFLGVLAVLLVRGVLADRPNVAAGPAGGVPVVVTTSAVGRGALLQPAQLKVVTFPAASVPAGSFRKIEDVAPPGGQPRVALREFVANEPVINAKLSGDGAGANLAGALGPGMRAVGVRVSDVAGVGGFALPGDRVDVVVTRQVGSAETATSILNVLAENVRVLGVDQSADADKPIVAKAVTLEVTPEQAQTITLAQAVGAVSLTLRQTSDGTPLSRKQITVAELGGVRPASVVRIGSRPAPPRPQVRVTRGVDVSGYPVPN